ncbi:hypothetical protein GCM10009678_31370 [Actinomadura kijaniata]|uniref:Uncharacterized protein n=1 Tax=Actinomadura namibiensis TaxID=182080 RepID=A0A7W3LID8_ACTNM|nr:hypothetical protein [Actinomadura namibiensis]MBA8948721.1 hypothetical protein [Actinomadura namibiensis]
MDKPVTRWVPLDVCSGIVEQTIRETLDGRFFRGTVEEVLYLARRKVEELWNELEQAEGPPSRFG